MQYKGAVFFDYDGTLTDERAGIATPSARTRRAIQALRRNGYLTVLTTGRAKCYAKDTGIDFDGMITSNGPYVEACGQVIYDHPIAEDTLCRLMARLNEMGIYYGIDHPLRCYARDIKEATFQNWLHTYGISEEIFRPIVPHEKPVGYKLSVLYHTEEEVDRLRAEFHEEFVFDCMRGFQCADVNCSRINKGTGVRAVCEWFHLPHEHTYAFGDVLNDLNMLQSVCHGIAMGDHAKELETCCEFVTHRVCEEGIEFGLQHFGLIGSPM